MDRLRLLLVRAEQQGCFASDAFGASGSSLETTQAEEEEEEEGGHTHTQRQGGRGAIDPSINRARQRAWACV